MDAKTITFVVATILLIKAKEIETQSPLEHNCDYNCGKYYQLTERKIMMEAINTEKVPMLKKSFTKQISVDYMWRKKYAMIKIKNFGSKPVFYENKHVLPNKEEALQWSERGQCKIGTVCQLNGECWGRDSDECRSDSTKNWVNGRTMKYEGLSWDTTFREACTMDWSCSIRTYIRQVTSDISGNPQFDAGGSSQYLTPNIHNQFFKKEDHVILVKEPIKSENEIIKADCFRENDSLYCEDRTGPSTTYFVIEKGEKCKAWGHIAYCIGESKEIRENPENKVASTLNDIKEVSQALRVVTKIINRNAFTIANKIVEIEKVINTLTIELLPNNPLLLSNFTGQKSFSRKMSNGVVEMCPCKKDLGCKEREEHHLNEVQFCIPMNSTIGNIQIFSTNALIEEAGDESFDFIGKEINPELDEIERQFYSKDIKNEFEKTNNILVGLPNTFSFVEIIKGWSGPVALVISLVLLFKR